MIILTKEQISQKIKRIAREVCERHSEDKELIIIGIKDQGALFAQQITDELLKIGNMKCILGNLQIDKMQPASAPIILDLGAAVLKNKPVLLVDDVANSGKTMFYALAGLSAMLPKSIEIAVLIERFHKRFPVEVGYCGLQLATTVKDHISVVFSDSQNWKAELN